MKIEIETGTEFCDVCGYTDWWKIWVDGEHKYYCNNHLGPYANKEECFMELLELSGNTITVKDNNV